uniref:Claudin 15 n=1 Tax=Cairina moschata TaxID=8855 RepID=A0A8C3CCE6_CAIMO
MEFEEAACAFLVTSVGTGAVRARHGSGTTERSCRNEAVEEAAGCLRLAFQEGLSVPALYVLSISAPPGSQSLLRDKTHHLPPKDSVHIQACRALMIVSILLGFIAAVLSLLGLKCTNIGISDEDGKMKFAVTGGFLFILGGLSSMVAVSWYAAMITAQFFDPLYAGTKYELGDALYLGWAGSILYILGGIFLTCSCKGKKKMEYSASKYRYSAGQPALQQQIYTKNSETVTSAKEYV